MLVIVICSTFLLLDQCKPATAECPPDCDPSDFTKTLEHVDNDIKPESGYVSLRGRNVKQRTLTA